MAIFKSHRGLNWHYTQQGDGPVILFIHGFGGSSLWWHNQVAFLQRDFCVITVDLPGHGQSSWMPITPIEIAMDLRQLISFLGVSQITVVSCSMGGLFAFELYRQIPSDIMRMSFVGALPKFARSENYPAGLDIEKIKKLSNQFDGDYGAILEIFFRSLFTMQERDSEIFKAVRQMRTQETLPTREALKHFLTILEKHDLRDRIATIICPLQFIAGSEDYICPPAIMAWLSEHTYNARFDTMAGFGHLPFLTDVKEYNRLLEDFLIS